MHSLTIGQINIGRLKGHKSKAKYVKSTEAHSHIPLAHAASLVGFLARLKVGNSSIIER